MTDAPENRARRPWGSVAEPGLWKRDRPAYRRKLRELNGLKRPGELDRSKPKGHNIKNNRSTYHRQYMRWYRAQKKAKAQ